MDRALLLSRLKAKASNSSHFLWLLGEFEFYRTSGGSLFALKRIGKVAVLALEPLEADGNLADELEELKGLLGVNLLVFVGIGSSFTDRLRDLRWQVLPVGREPWIDLRSPIATGNASKGVRAARNQALRAGVEVRELAPPFLRSEGASSYRAQLEEVHSQWSDSSLLQITGFLNTTRPFAYTEERRYFAAFSQDRPHERIEAFLVVSPIYGSGNVFIEDLFFRSDAARGATELLLFETLQALKNDGRCAEASLGVVSMRTLGKDLSAVALPTSARRLIAGFCLLSRLFYNSDGIELFRKRFNPRRWEPISVALQPCQNGELAQLWDWVRAAGAIVRCFRLRFHLRGEALSEWLLRPVWRHPVTATWLAVCTALFVGINRGETIPQAALERFGFSFSAPLQEWLYRTFSSDLLCYDLSHFATLAALTLLLLSRLERRFGSITMGLVLIGTSLVDDFLNFIFVYRVASVHPTLTQLLRHWEVGSSFILMTLFGIALRQYRALRSSTLVTTLMALIPLALLASNDLRHATLNAAHFLFLLLGFGMGEGLRLLQLHQSGTRTASPSRKAGGRSHGQSGSQFISEIPGAVPEIRPSRR